MAPSTASSSGLSSHTSRTGDRWKSIEFTTRSRLSQLDLNLASLPDSQRTFRQEFEELCRAHSIPNVQTLLCKVDASFYHIDLFVKAINHATYRINYVGFGSHVWGLCFAILQVCISCSSCTPLFITYADRSSLLLCCTAARTGLPTPS
jgi:hypothetical protein